jgi:tetratricopeptide (TPR) repeat protein
VSKITINQALKQGVDAHKAGQAQEAHRIYAAILKLQPKHPDANHNTGLLAVEFGKIELALPFFKTALEANPSNKQFWYSHIVVLMKLERLIDAKILLDQAKIEGINGADFDQLEYRLNEAIKTLTIKPDYADAYNNLGNTFQEQSKLEEAIEAYNKALTIKPDYAEAYNNIGAALQKQRKLEEAIKAYNKALAIKPNYVDAYYNIGITLQKQRKLEEAVEAYNKALSIKPDYAEAYNNIGVALQDQGKLEKAIEAFSKTLTIKPDYAEAYSNMAIALKDQGKFEEAVEAFSKALAINPDYAEAYNNIGVALQDQGKLKEALEIYNNALAVKPDFAEAYNNKGTVLQKQGNLEEAIKTYNKAVTIKLDYADAYNNMGNALQEQSKLEEAIEAYNKALNIKPNHAEAFNNMGIALQKQRKPEEAIKAYNKALSINPDYAAAYYNIGNTLQEQYKLEKAKEAFSKAIAINPDYAEAYSNMAVTLQDQGKLEETIDAFYKALTIKPDCAETHKNLSLALLNSGRLKEGLEEYEWRWNTSANMTTYRQFSKPMWNGKETLKGKTVLLWCEQGVGDTINWSSKLPFVVSQADHCILECQEKLVPLLTRTFPNFEIKAEDRRQDAQRDDFDFHLPMGSLYKHFISEISEKTRPNAFLVPDPVRVKFWRKRLESLGNGPFIGISWKSANMSARRLPNYAPISDWSPIFTIPGVKLINLQYTDFLDDLKEIKNKFGVIVHNFDDLDHYNDLEDVAALCAALDIVVSTKITVPLISAGVGTVTKLANWRQSSWNNILLNPVGPLVDIFEKDTLEPWHELFSAIAEDIMKFSIKYNNNLGSS